MPVKLLLFDMNAGLLALLLAAAAVPVAVEAAVEVERDIGEIIPLRCKPCP